MKLTRIPLLIAVTLALAVSACTTTQIQQTKAGMKTATDNVAAFLAKPTTKAAVKTIIAEATPLVKQYAETGKVSNAQGIEFGLQAITAIAPTVTSNVELQKLIVNTVTVYSGDPSAKNLGKDLAQIVINQLAPTSTPQDVTNAVVALGIGASNGANDPAVVK